MSYWFDRELKTQEKLLGKNQKEINKQLSKYYGKAMRRVIADFENTYNKLLVTVGEDKQPSPADLYKLDKYWQLQAQLRKELQNLGDIETVILSKQFEIMFFDVYNSISLPSGRTFSTISTEGANQLINAIWCADGLSWNRRVWNNIELLQQELNDGLLDCVINGKKTTQLKNQLQERFDVSYSKADRLVRTELAHIQTLSAKQRYEDAGIKYYEILGNEDDTCGNHGIDCHEKNGNRYAFSEFRIGVNAPPFHPNCKCAIVPVIEV